MKKIIITEGQYRLLLKEDDGLKTVNGDIIKINEKNDYIDYANERINQYNITSNYSGIPLFIGVTGKLKQYYTLWKRNPEFDFYMKNLSTDLKKAVDETLRIAELQKAEYIDFEDEVNESRKPVDEIIFGKYKGMKLGEVFLENKGYIVWLSKNFEPKTKRDYEFLKAINSILDVYVKDKTEKNKASDEKNYYPNEGIVDTTIKITNVSEYIDEIYMKASLNIRGESEKYRFAFFIGLDKIFKETNIEHIKDGYKLIGREVKIRGSVKDRKEISGLKYTILSRVSKFEVLGGSVIPVISDEEIDRLYLDFASKKIENIFNDLVDNFHQKFDKFTGKEYGLKINDYDEEINSLKNKIVIDKQRVQPVLDNFFEIFNNIDKEFQKNYSESDNIDNSKLMRDYLIYADILQYFFNTSFIRPSLNNDFKALDGNIYSLYYSDEYKNIEDKRLYLKSNNVIK